MSDAPGGPVPGGGDAEQVRGWHQQGPAQGGSGGPQQGWAPQMPQAGQYVQPFPQGSYLPQVRAQTGSNGMAIGSLVLGITSIIFCWWGLFTLAQVVLAIMFGVKGMNRADAGAGGKGLAQAGLICGCVGAVAYLFVGIVTAGIGFFI